jgi:hypothetical protein
MLQWLDDHSSSTGWCRMRCFSDASDSGYGAHGIEHPVLSGKDRSFGGSQRSVVHCGS